MYPVPWQYWRNLQAQYCSWFQNRIMYKCRTQAFAINHQTLTFSQKSSIVEVWQGSKYASLFYLKVVISRLVENSHMYSAELSEFFSIFTGISVLWAASTETWKIRCKSIIELSIAITLGWILCFIIVFRTGYKNISARWPAFWYSGMLRSLTAFQKSNFKIPFFFNLWTNLITLDQTCFFWQFCSIREVFFRRSKFVQSTDRCISSFCLDHMNWI